jgi:hypothetical protein
MYESRSQGEVEALQSATDDSELTRLLKFNGCVSRQIASFRSIFGTSGVAIGQLSTCTLWR